ncbi:MAG: histone deacetylase family protein [Acidimicrobiales bacterium]
MQLIVTGDLDGSEHARSGHPERPGRVTAALAGVADLQLGDDLLALPARPAGLDDLTRVHESGYLEGLATFCGRGGGDLDRDTYAGARSWQAARMAAGAGLVAIEALKLHPNAVAFAAARPPGHHALPDRAMGFCLLNNIAVAAAFLAARGERVLIVDWDVHHGNGTQAIFWDDPRVLYVSTHQSPLFPGSGHPSEVGGTSDPGGTVNIPLPPGATGDVVREALEEVAAPAVDRFGPTWVLVSAGFDAHRADPLADLALCSGDFAHLSRIVAGFTPQAGRLVLFLEGGYDLRALRESVAAALGALLDAPPTVHATTSGGPGAESIHLTRLEREEALHRVESASMWTRGTE